MKQPRTEIVDALQRKASSEKAQWWNDYLKGEIPFMGIGTPDIRKLFLDRNRVSAYEDLTMNRQVALVNGLMRGSYAEEKLAAILFVQLFWLGNQRNSFLINLVSDWFEDRLVFDWNTCDWLSVRILSPLIDSGEEEVIWKLKGWNRDSYLWKARASLVPFARANSIASHGKSIYRFSDILIRRKERFAKTAVGWVMREYSRHDPEFVLDFISRHAKYTTAEVKRNALKYYRKDRK